MLEAAGLQALMLTLLPLIWLNLVRDRTRSLLTLGAIAFATTLLCLLQTLPAGLDSFLASVAGNSRISVHNRAGLSFGLPYAYLAKIRSVPGVVDAVSWSTFGGAIDLEKGATFPSFAVDSEPLRAVYEDLGIEPEAMANFGRYRNSALIGRQLAKQYGWHVGDTVTLKSTRWPIELSMRVVGEIPNDLDPRFWLRREYVEEALATLGRKLGRVGIIWARVDDPRRMDETMRRIDALFANSEDETASESERSFFGKLFINLEAIIPIILVVIGLVTVSIFFVAANTAELKIREQLREVAILKAIGFGRRALLGVLLLEGVLLASIAGVLGVGMAYGLTELIRSLVGWNAALGPLASFIITGRIAAQSLLLALAVGFLSAALPSFKASRRNVTELLHEVF
jgi:putative ABC transport system permease protein